MTEFHPDHAGETELAGHPVDSPDLHAEGLGEVAAGSPGSEPEPVRTGFPVVDQVLADVDGLDQAPLEEHLPVFERAHERLRAALDADPGEPA